MRTRKEEGRMGKTGRQRGRMEKTGDEEGEDGEDWGGGGEDGEDWGGGGRMVRMGRLGRRVNGEDWGGGRLGRRRGGWRRLGRRREDGEDCGGGEDGEDWGGGKDGKTGEEEGRVEKTREDEGWMVNIFRSLELFTYVHIKQVSPEMK